jgi:hypothetical protein
VRCILTSIIKIELHISQFREKKKHELTIQKELNAFSCASKDVTEFSNLAVHVQVGHNVHTTTAAATATGCTWKASKARKKTDACLELVAAQADDFQLVRSFSSFRCNNRSR